MNQAPACRVLRLVLGDQLSAAHPWFDAPDPDVLHVIAELRQETDYACHHLQKVLAFFAAMRAFAGQLERDGHRVLHLDLDATAGHADLAGLLDELLACTGARRFEYQRPDEYRLLRQLESYCERLDLPSVCVASGHFMVPYAELGERFAADGPLRMETFYRQMRRATGLLMDEQGKPAGGRWNFDAENRQPLPAGADLPEPLTFANDIRPLRARLERHAVATLGELRGPELPWPVNRDQSRRLLRHFIDDLLPQFGKYQDALTDRGWALFHSRLSFSLNTKMLAPREVLEAVESAWREQPDRYPLAAVEGFVRQVLGWREFMRGVYWTRMPAYAECNELGHERALPGYYWTGETRMACMRQALGQSLDHAYAHHIQRLMITGNFALLAGVDPDAVDAWYLGIYIDALEWVELPNTRGMSQFADGGVVASKPYAASGNYINRMGDHCAGCHYSVGRRSGPGSCPFNSLYWHFMERHRERLGNHPRSALTYGNWDRMDPDKRRAILATARSRLENIESL